MLRAGYSPSHYGCPYLSVFMKILCTVPIQERRVYLCHRYMPKLIILLDSLKKYSICPIRNETFSFLVCSIKNEMFLKMETMLSLFFLLSYFTLSSLTHKITLHKIPCRKANVVYLMGRREYYLSPKIYIFFSRSIKLGFYRGVENV